MKKTAYLLLFSVLFCTAFGVNPVNVQSRQAKGVGSTRSLAIKNALYDAVSQVQGVVVTSGMASSSASVGNIDVTREEVNKSIEMEGISVSAVDSLSVTLAEGLVKSYDVVEERQKNDGTYEVTLNVQVYDYQSPLASTKMSLAVTEFEAEQSKAVFGDIQISGDELSRQFSQRLTTLLRDSNRFDLLDRAYEKAYHKENEILKSGQTDLEQKAKVGEVIGADYLLSGRIRRAAIETERKEIPSTGIRSKEYRGYFVSEVRLLVPSTRQVAFSHEYRMKLETPEIKSLADEWKRDERDFDQIKDAFLDLAARRIIEDILNDLYPVRVALVEGDKVILDQGGDRMMQGAVYEVYSMGQKVVDPQTQEVLGQAQKKVASLEITHVLPKFCYAAVLDAKDSDIKVGQICRICPESLDLKIEIEGGMKSNIKRNSSGGVKLPFDN